MQYYTFSQKNQGREGNKKSMLFVDVMILYIEKTKDSTKGTFGKDGGMRVIIIQLSREQLTNKGETFLCSEEESWEPTDQQMEP